MDYVLDFLPDLKTFNLILFVVHLIAALALLVYAFIRSDSEFTFDITRGESTYALSSRTVVYMAVAFLAITSLVHLFYWFDWGGRYSTGAYSGRQYYRWLEYGVTATIMAIIIAVISGVTDFYTLLSLGALTVGVMATGMWFEQIYGMGSALIPLLIGFFLLGVYIVVVFWNYWDVRTRESLPSWITWAVIGTLIFFSSFGVVPVVRWSTNHRPVYSEYAYLILSAVAKLYLGFFLGYGLLQREA